MQIRYSHTLCKVGKPSNIFILSWTSHLRSGQYETKNAVKSGEWKLCNINWTKAMVSGGTLGETYLKQHRKTSLVVKNVV